MDFRKQFVVQPDVKFKLGDIDPAYKGAHEPAALRAGEMGTVGVGRLHEFTDLFQSASCEPPFLPAALYGEVGEEHAFSAEAISDCQVLLINRSVIMARAAREPAVARELWTLFGHESERMQHHTLLLIRNAQERVASFLLEMAGPISEGSNIIKLPMTRRDIADYLGLTIETVCRTFVHLEATAAIEVHSHRQIVLRNRSALRRLNG
jgi:CRP/FNR family nitrogen fixation transcriptional regulator